jgi:Holliday junction resolvasome RuvABC DNA-binding subunit
MILSDPNYRFALSLTEYMKFDDVVHFYTDYTNIGEAGVDGGTHFETGTSFEDYTDLIMLGYTKEDIKKAVKGIEDTGSTNWRDYNMKNYFLNNDN